ncbi:MAG: hypothetical protein ABWZ52_01410, partial [Acidimicrobiales bacterium]
MSAEDEARQRERRAIVGLALASLPKEQEDKVRNEVFAAKGKDEPPKLKEALVDLKELTDAERRKSHRVLSLDLLAKVADRRPDALEDDVEDEVEGFARAAVVEGLRRPSGKGSRGVAKAEAPGRGGVDEGSEAAATDGEEPSRDQSVEARVPAVVSALRTARSPTR